MHNIKIEKSVTNRSGDSLNRYLSDIGQIDMISTQEEVQLAIKIREGDEAAIQKLVTTNLRFVVSCAKKYQHTGLSLSDLISEGNIGLIKAAKMFDETRGFKFISYAVWWIRQAMITALNEHIRTIRVPMNQQLGMSKVQMAIQKLEQELQRDPTVEEIAIEISKSEAQVSDYICANSRTSFLDDQLPGGGSEMFTLMDCTPDSEPTETHRWIESDSLQKELQFLVQILDQREKQIITLAYGLFGNPEISSEDIAFRLGLSEERIRQIKLLALKKMRSHPQAQKLKSYLS